MVAHVSRQTAGAQPASSGIPAALANKLLPPRSRCGQIKREAISERLLGADTAKLVLLRAPAGFGKTTAMVQARDAISARGATTAWLSFDSADNDVGRFLLMINAAVGCIVVKRIPKAGWPAASADLSATLEMIAQVSAHEQLFVLFLDEAEAIHNAAVFALLREFVERLPPQGQIVMASRTVPPLGLARLRASGHLLEIGPADLRFSASESQNFLCGARNLPLNHLDVVRLHEKTGGWPVALWLASLSLEKHEQPNVFIAHFSGSDSTVADYFAEDLLVRLPSDVRDFMLRTSILTRLSPALCNAVCGRTDSDEVLANLYRIHQFLEPLGDDQLEYRYHSLFAEVLREQLRASMPQELPVLHKAAARWYMENSRPVPAIEHAVASGELTTALTLLESEADGLLSQGRVRLLSRWLDTVPAAALRQYPLLQVVRAWAIALTRGHEEARKLIETLNPIAENDRAVVDHLRALRPMLLLMADRIEEFCGLSAEALLQEMPQKSFPRSMLLNVAASSLMLSGRGDEAGLLLDHVRSDQMHVDSPFNLIYSECIQASFEFMQGRLQEALGRLRVAAGARIGDSSAASTNGNVMAGVQLALALYETGECAQAERLLRVALPVMNDLCLPEHLIAGHICLARISCQRGDMDRAYELLTEVEHRGYRRGLLRVVAGVCLERSRLNLLAGNSEAARRELHRAEQIVNASHELRYWLLGQDVETTALGHFRLRMREGTATALVSDLRRALQVAQDTRRGRRALQLRLVLAEALQRDQQRAAAMNVLHGALTFAAREGFLMCFAVEGEAVAELLTDYRRSGAESIRCTGGLPAGFLSRVMQVNGLSAESEPIQASTTAGFEPLTRKEVQVLQLAAEGLSNGLLSKRLFVSETTVRTHLRNINVKLGASNRTGAIAIARRLGLM